MKRWHHEVIAFSLTLGFPAIIWHALKWLVIWVWGQPQLDEWGLRLAWIAWGPGFIVGFCVLNALNEHLARVKDSN
jgi:hypothetical protein